VIQGGARAATRPSPTEHPVSGNCRRNYPVGSVAAAKPDRIRGDIHSQFFIVTGAATRGSSLANDYARFGSVSRAWTS